MPTGANAEYHAKIVRDKAMVRSLIHAGNEILRDAYDRTQSADELVSQAERKIMDIAKAGMIGETHTLNEAVQEAFDADRLASREGERPLDQRHADGLRRSRQHHARGCRTPNSSSSRRGRAVGKTAFALNIVRNIITRPIRSEHARRGVLVSLEMARDRAGRAAALLPVAAWTATRSARGT